MGVGKERQEEGGEHVSVRDKKCQTEITDMHIWVCRGVCTWCTGPVPLDCELSSARVRLQVEISRRRQSWR